MKLHFFHKLLIIALVLGFTFVYSYYEKNKYYNDQRSQEYVLKELPNFNVKNIGSDSLINSREFATSSAGLFVHLWGTWCAPCETEMPDFLEYARKVEDTGAKFLLIAVNDEEPKIQKFLKRFPNLPKNVTYVIDHENKVLDLLGTLKVPETFLFSNQGKHINKFIGPQEWRSPSYVTRLNFWLGGQKSAQEGEQKAVETH